MFAFVVDCMCCYLCLLLVFVFVDVCVCRWVCVLLCVVDAVVVCVDVVAGVVDDGCCCLYVLLVLFMFSCVLFVCVGGAACVCACV